MFEWREDILFCRRCRNATYPSLEGKVLHGQHLPWCPSARIYDNPVDLSKIVTLAPPLGWEPFKNLEEA